MTDATPTPSDPTATPTAACPTCGYDLRGLPPGATCPECGGVSATAITGKGTAGPWERTVAFGLLAWVGLAVVLTAVVLLLPFRDELGGTLAILNVPGPKVWAASVVYRQTGYAPAFWGTLGVVGTLLNLGAVWLMTAPRTERDWHEGPLSIRPLARWLPTLLVGGLLGLTLGASKVGDRRLEELVMIAVTVEAVGTSLVYLHLRSVAATLGRRSLASALGVAGVVIPLLALAGGGAVLAERVDGYTQRYRGDATFVAAATLYGAAAIPAGLFGASCCLRLRRVVLDGVK